MKILVIGRSGRDHTLAWSLAKSDKVEKVFIAPGNGGAGVTEKCEQIDIDAEALDELVEFAKENNISLVVSGSAYSLIAGVTDKMEEAEIKCFGPSKKAANFEGSKAFSKEFMKRNNIPTPFFETFNRSELSKAIDYVSNKGAPIVVKTSSAMLGGQNVRICHTIEDAEAAIYEYLEINQTVEEIVIEKYVIGVKEVSYAVMTDGTNIIPFPACRDYKKRDNGEKGVNTDGIGVFTPIEYLTSEIENKIINNIVQPSIDAMRNEGIPYKGFLYTGIMIDENNEPLAIEYNCRLGDPETEVMLSKLQTDFLSMIEACYNGTLNEIKVEWDDLASVCVAVAQKDYPFRTTSGGEIKNLDNLPKNIKIFHSGTKVENGKIISTGGRVINVVATGKDIVEAQKNVYAAINMIDFGFETHYRTDIADLIIKGEY